MIELFGSPVSNCYNTVLAALHHKGLVFEQRPVAASRERAFLRHSPMGKIPYIRHDGISLSETSAIIDYLDETFTGPALLAGSALLRARQRQLMKFVELYVETPARRLFPGVFWCQTNAALHIDEVRPVIERGMDAIEVLLADNPELQQLPAGAGHYYSYFSLSLAGLVTEQQYGWSLLADRPQLKYFLQRLDELAFMPGITSQRDAAMTGYLAKKAAEAGAVRTR